jgi:DNA invertase Pin-like site-specific DNA recombinase
MIYGYARVSTEGQNLDSQLDALQAAGCDRIFEEKASGARDDRPEWMKLRSHLRAGDQVVVFKLDRLGRGLRRLIDLVGELQSMDVEFRSLSDNIDTSTAMGKFMFHVFAALSEMERDLLRERTNAGLVAARARGRKGGRRPKLTEAQIAMARRMLQDPEVTIKSVAEVLKVTRATVYRSLGLGAWAAMTADTAAGSPALARGEK